jgi:hypothetical protein
MAISVGAKSKTRIIYIAGDGRSGTTILSQILGSYDGCLAVGELYDIWLESLDGDKLCSCGEPLRTCAFWTTVMKQAFGDDVLAITQRAIELRRSVHTMYQLPFAVYPRMRTGSFRRHMQEYTEILERLYSTIQEVSGCDGIVDSSKLAAYALALAESPKLDVNFLHVYRDSRACAYSWQRFKLEPLASRKTKYMVHRSLSRSALVWTIRNMVLASIADRFPVSVNLRYEDFVHRPSAEMARVSCELGLRGHDQVWIGDDEALISSSNHIFAGNPVRVRHGPVHIRDDDEWRERMPRRQQRFVLALSSPALWRLGYLGGHDSVPDLVESERVVRDRVV